MFEKLWGRERKMPYTEAAMNNLAYSMHSSGEVYMLAYKNKTRTFELLEIHDDSKILKNEIDIDGKLAFRKFDLFENEEGNLVCAGFYGNGTEISYSFMGGLSASFNTNGIYYFQMEVSGRVIEQYEYEFPIDFIKQYLSERQAGKSDKRESAGKAGIADLSMVEFHIDDEGNAIILGERQWAKKEMVGTQTKVVWHYANMVMAKISKDGTLLWMKKLPKNQAGTAGIGQMSLMYAEGEDAHYMLFVDNPKNADISIKEVPEYHKDGRGGFLTAFKIDDKTGEFERHTIFDLKEVNGIDAFQFNVSRVFDVEDKMFMCEVYIKGKKDTMIKMELK